MFPMIATVEEFDEAKALVERELTHLRRHGHKLPERVDVGSMVEVPSLLYQLDELYERVDFLSIGSNDLVQFFYAADRGNARVADRFDPISVPVLRALREIALKGRAHNKPVAVCGEPRSRPIGALVLVAIGFRLFSPALRGRPGQGHAARSRHRQGDGADRAAARWSGRRRGGSRPAQGIRDRARFAAVTPLG